MIDFEDSDPVNKERWLHIVAPMDRENEKIDELGGILTYMVTVRDLGGNENSMAVSFFGRYKSIILGTIVKNLE